MSETLLIPVVFPMQGIVWVAFVLAAGWRLLLVTLLYVCPGCASLHRFSGF